MLCIEDNSTNLLLMETLFERLAPMRLVSAIRAEEGVRLANALLPDVILLDINLPGMDGFEAFAQLQANEATRHIPVVGVSADASATTTTRARAEGFADFLTKPVRLATLVHTLRRLMEEEHADQE